MFTSESYSNKKRLRALIYAKMTKNIGKISIGQKYKTPPGPLRDRSTVYSCETSFWDRYPLPRQWRCRLHITAENRYNRVKMMIQCLKTWYINKIPIPTRELRDLSNGKRCCLSECLLNTEAMSVFGQIRGCRGDCGQHRGNICDNSTRRSRLTTQNRKNLPQHQLGDLALLP